MRRRALGLGLAAVLLVAVAVVEARSVLWFHTVTPWSPPHRMHVCGRDYRRAGPAPAARARGPLWQPVYGSKEPAFSGAPCGTVVYLRQGDGYRAYALVGGP